MLRATPATSRRSARCFRPYPRGRGDGRIWRRNQRGWRRSGQTRHRLSPAGRHLLWLRRPAGQADFPYSPTARASIVVASWFRDTPSLLAISLRSRCRLRDIRRLSFPEYFAASSSSASSKWRFAPASLESGYSFSERCSSGECEGTQPDPGSEQPCFPEADELRGTQDWYGWILHPEYVFITADEVGCLRQHRGENIRVVLQVSGI